jgi:hypothetical protein
MLDNRPAPKIIKDEERVAVGLACRFAGALLRLTRETPEL